MELNSDESDIMSTDYPENTHSLETTLIHAGRPNISGMPFVNPPVVRASTVLFDSIDDMAPGRSKYSYGRRGTPTSDALEEAIAELEGAEGCVLAPSGLAGISVALLSFLGAGDHVLITDTAYFPTRDFADKVLTRMGVSVTYFDPLIGAGIESLVRPNTKVIYTEAPGSLTFEMQDIPAITRVARAHDIITVMDNTWATPVFFRPLDFGVDVSLMAATKYIVGHSDAMIGTVAAGPRAWKQLKDTHGIMGMFTGPDDMWLALRGLRTLGIRLARHQESALKVANWVGQQPGVARVLYPALPSDPGHAIWKRDFKGASGLFSFVLDKPHGHGALAAMLDGLQLFGRGYSWGGYESLAIPAHLKGARTATTLDFPGPVIRLHIGLENPDDLIADLDAAFGRLTRA
jgi:cystathionine beta-lyase